MPVQESPYETEAYERLKAMNSLELTRLAIRSRTDYGIHDRHRRERLLLAGGWIIRWTKDRTGASDPDIRSFDHTSHPYDTWDGFITALSCQTQPEAPTDLRPLVEQAPPGDATVHLSDMTPIQVREFAMRFHRAAVIELDQRPHTVPKRMRQPATAALRSLSYETTRREHYTTGRYREVVGHATRAYLACRFPGRWEAAIDELGKATAVRRRSEDIDDIPVMQNLQEWLAAAELEYITEVASRPPEDNTSAIWRDAIRLASKTPVPPSKTAPTSTPPTQETDTG